MVLLEIDPLKKKRKSYSHLYQQREVQEMTKMENLGTKTNYG